MTYWLCCLHLRFIVGSHASWRVFPPWLYAETARVCPCPSNLRWTLWYWWRCKGVGVCVLGQGLSWRANDRLVSDWQTDRAGSAALSVSDPHCSITVTVFLTPVVTFYARPSDANTHASSAEAGDRRRRKGDKMDAKPGVTDVWGEVHRVISAWFFHEERFLNKLSPTPAGHLSPSK